MKLIALYERLGLSALYNHIHPLLCFLTHVSFLFHFLSYRVPQLSVQSPNSACVCVYIHTCAGAQVHTLYVYVR